VRAAKWLAEARKLNPEAQVLKPGA